MSEDRDGRSDLGSASSQVIELSSHLGPASGPSPGGVTHEITPRHSPKKRLHLPPWHIPVAWKRDEHKRAETRESRAARKAEKKAAKPQPPARRRELPRILRAPRMLALLVLSACLVLTLVTSIAESWRDLYEWGRNHALSPFWANGVPLMVDTFIVVGEAALLVMAIDGIRNWKLSARAWAVFLFGLSISLVGNVGHLRHANISTRGTSALPPLAAAISLSIALGMVKMIASYYDRELVAQPQAPEPVAQPVAPHAPALNLDHLASILVPPVAHQDKVAHPVAQDGAPAPVAPKVARRTVNGATRPAPGRGVEPEPEVYHSAREHLGQLRHDGVTFPSVRKFAESHFNPTGESGKGNRRAAQRTLDEFREAP